MNQVEIYLKQLQEKINDLKSIEILALFEILKSALLNNQKIVICGNGGSASTGEHFATDLLKSVGLEGKKKINVINLTANSSIFSAFSNDYGYENSFSKQIQNVGNKGDLLFCISASGNSKNVINAIKVAQKLEMITVCLVGFDGGFLDKNCDYSLLIPINDYGIVEDIHLSICHILARLLSKI